MEKPADDLAPLASAKTPATAPPDVLAVAVFQPRRVAFPRRALVLYVIWAMLILIVGAEAGYLASYFQQAKYGARSEIYFELDNSLPSGFLRTDRALATQLVAIKSRETLLPVAQASKLTVNELSKKLHASIVTDSEVIRVEVDDPSRTRATALVSAITTQYLKTAKSNANADAETFVKAQIADLDKRRDGLNADAARLEASRLGRATLQNPNPAASPQQLSVQNELASVIDQRRDLERRLDEITLDRLKQPRIQQLTQPYLLDDPVSPKPLRAALAGALAAFAIVAVAATFLIRRHLSDPRS
jgi:hypothetical protein